MRYRQNTKGDILYGPPVTFKSGLSPYQKHNNENNKQGRNIVEYNDLLAHNLTSFSKVPESHFSLVLIRASWCLTLLYSLNNLKKDSRIFFVRWLYR